MNEVQEKGICYLVGAGPGDLGLVTLKAKECIEKCDVLVYDALVGEKIMELVSADCELEFAGKRGGKPSPKQKDISLRLVELAEQGKKVLRLKGGDPFIFGRGGEEAFHLFKAGIPFRIIPGVTAGIGGPAYAGIPVTHRDFNSAVTFIAGRGSAGELPERHNWEAIAKGSPVIVMYMATKYICEIMDLLINHGRLPDEPVAVITQACLPEQMVFETKLSKCSEDIKKNGIKPPALIVVGKVVSLRRYLNWMD